MLTKEGVEPDEQKVLSNASGSFSLNYFPNESGIWSASASWEGDTDHLGAISEPKAFNVSQAQTALTITVSAGHINVNETVNITGIITLTPDTQTGREKFLEEQMQLIRINPDGGYEDAIEAQPFLVGDQLPYKFEGVALPITGVWKLQTGFTEDVFFKGANSEMIEIEVELVQEEVAGYAILVEGRVKGNSGIASHNLTTNYIRQKLLRRGFTNDTIYYFNFKTKQAGVDEVPTKEGVLNAIKTWGSQKMNGFPAPLYIVFVGHGDEDTFFIDPDTLTAQEISDAVSTLESTLDAEASEKAIVLVLGANHSGGFIDNLSKPNTKRIVIASSDTKEIAYKGPLPPEGTTRHGDYFAAKFFKYAATGISIKKCYEETAKEVALFTKNKDGNGLHGESAGNGQYFDNAGQHPLLEDNGDGVGTYRELSSIAGRDGAQSANLVLGKGDAGTPLELTRVSDIIGLDHEADAPALFAQVNDTRMVGKMWTEIASPGHSLPYQGNKTEQQVVDLSRFNYNYFDEGQQKYIWNDFSGDRIDDFEKAGEYEVYYFGLDANTGDITPLMNSNVYRNEEENKVPSAFKLISPKDGATTPVALQFDWEDSIDTDGDDVKYTFTLSKSRNFDSIDYRVKDLTASTVVVDKEASLEDGIIYY